MATFTIGETKIRPGVYTRYENAGTPQLAAASSGVVALTLQSQWGPLASVCDISSEAQALSIFGSGGTTSAISQALRGGASLIKAIRVGSGGQKASAILRNFDSDNCVTVSALYPGLRQLSISIRDSLSDPSLRELLIMEDSSLLHSITFEKSDNEADSLLAADPNPFVSFSKAPTASGSLSPVTQLLLSGGEAPDCTNESYAIALEALEAHSWNVLALDTNQPQIHSIAAGFVKRLFSYGKQVLAVVAEPISVPLETRMSNASSFNSFQMHYFGGGWYDTQNNLVDGWLAASYFAGLIASCPSNRSITHTSISGAARLAEFLTAPQYEKSILSGMLTVSTDSSNRVWVECGINTLVNPSADDDHGWKKIRRTKERFELLQRISDSISPIIGSIDNDPDGRATIIKLAQGVCNVMTAEKKLAPGASVVIDPNNPPVGDSAWFVISVDDLDSIEKSYLSFRFRFSAED